jgi:PAS domain S-box-containing protein
MPNPQPPPLTPARRHVRDEGRGSVPLSRAAVADDAVQLRHALSDRTAELDAAFAAMRAALEATGDGIVIADAGGHVTAFNERFLQLSGLERSEVEQASLAHLRRRAPALFAETRRAPDGTLEPSCSEGAPQRVQLDDGCVLERHACEQRIEGRPAVRVWSYRDVTAHCRAESDLRDEAVVMQFLNATGATTAAMLDVETLLQAVIDAATEVSGASFGAFFYCDEAVRELIGPLPLAVEEPTPCPFGGTPRIALAGVARSRGEVFDSARMAADFAAAWHADHTLRCEDVSLPAGAVPLPVARRSRGGRDPLIRSFLAVPVTLRSGTTVGGLFFGHPDAGVFSERTERIVEGVAAHAAIALDNARLVDGMRRVAQEREQLIEAERSAREESARAMRLKEEFLATLSHELRTPLTAIIGWANVLLLGRADAPTQAHGLEAIVRNANSQADLIEDLLEMSRIVSGKVRLDVQPTDLARVIDAALDAVRVAAEAKGITLVRSVEGEGCHVMGDPARLQQLLWNLLSNAVKFTPRQGRVEIALAQTSDEIEIAVSDTGQGIDPAFLPDVFEHFRQGDGSTTRRHGGLGLGLAIVRQLATLHGGTVSAHSAGLGHGARFVVRLPCGDARETGPGHRRRPVTRPCPQPGTFDDTDLRGVDVLVVDDQADARELVAQLLVECGATVRQSASAAEAMREFIAHPPDVLLSDIGMPERDGYELIREIRRLQPDEGAQVPAIAVTAFAQPSDRALALEAGYQGYLSKPVQPHELVEAVAQVAPARGDEAGPGGADRLNSPRA